MLRRVLLMTALPGVVASQELHPIAMQQAETQPATLLQASTTPARSVRWHRALGTTALFSFGTALVAGAASGNLAKLMDETQCCPDGGQRNATWRTIDRTLVNVGIASYLGAAGIATWRAATHQSKANGSRKRVHRMLAMAHGLTFVTSAVTGAMMGDAQDTDPARFARIARIHVASNIAFVPLLTAAFTTMTVR